MRADSLRRAREAIVSTLSDYGITRYSQGRRTNHDVIEFEVNGQPAYMPYSTGDYRSADNLRSQTRRKLIEMGACKVSELPRKKTEHAKEPSMEAAAAQLHSVAANPEPVSGSAIEQPRVEMPPATAPAQSTHTEQGYVVFSTNKYSLPHAVEPITDQQFVAVKLDHELLAEKGSYLVIPLHATNVVWAMPAHEFNSLFRPKRKPAPVQPQPADRGRPMSTTTTEPVQSRPVPQPIARPPVQPVQQSVAQQSSVQRVPAYLDVDEAATEPVSPKPVRSSGELTVAPQTGRVLLAIYALHKQGHAEVTSAQLRAMLPPSDLTSLAPIISKAVSDGFLRRGSPMIPRGSKYIMTDATKWEVEANGFLPFTVRGMAIPKWLREALPKNAVG